MQPDAFPEAGSIVSGYITSVSHKGCFVRLSSNPALTGIVYLKDLSDDFITNPSEAFPVGRLVQARVVTCNPDQFSAKLSLKNSDVAGYEIMKEQLASLAVGDVVVGIVEKIMHFGVFIKIKNTSIVGLSRKHVAVSDEAMDLNQVYQEGDVVRAKVLSISLSKVSLGLRESCFTNDNNNNTKELSEEDPDNNIPEEVDEAEDDDNDDDEEDHNHNERPNDLTNEPTNNS